VDDPIIDFLRGQAHNYSCRVCGSNHRASALRKVGQHHNKVVVQVTCARCKDAFFLHIEFARAATRERRAAPSPRDQKPGSAPPVSADEVLDVHRLLDDHRGRLSDLLGKR